MAPLLAWPCCVQQQQGRSPGMDRTEMMGAEDEWRMVMWNEGKTRWDWLERKSLAWTGWQKGNWTGNSATRRSAVESRMGTSIGCRVGHGTGRPAVGPRLCVCPRQPVTVGGTGRGGLVCLGRINGSRPSENRDGNGFRRQRSRRRHNTNAMGGRKGRVVRPHSPDAAAGIGIVPQTSTNKKPPMLVPRAICRCAHSLFTSSFPLCCFCWPRQGSALVTCPQVGLYLNGHGGVGNGEEKALAQRIRHIYACSY